MFDIIQIRQETFGMATSDLGVAIFYPVQLLPKACVSF